jgi:hypothetical protein
MINLNKILITSVIICVNTYSFEVINGEELYFSAKCNQCHIPNHFQSKQRKASNYKQLEIKVDACRFNNDVFWYEDEKDSVVQYLNKIYYNFDIKK